MSNNILPINITSKNKIPIRNFGEDSTHPH